MKEISMFTEFSDFFKVTKYHKTKYQTKKEILIFLLLKKLAADVFLLLEAITILFLNLL